MSEESEIVLREITYMIFKVDEDAVLKFTPVSMVLPHNNPLKTVCEYATGVCTGLKEGESLFIQDPEGNILACSQNQEGELKTTPIKENELFVSAFEN